MGKRIIPQRRGRGTSVYRAPSHRYAGRPINPKVEKGKGVVKEIFHDPGHTAPLARVVLDNGDKVLMLAH
ncbi:Ribosomal Proteins L2, RNA binding domain, partial [Aciduliprofundum boonei T469]